MGMTLPVAQHWLNVYVSAEARGAGGATAPARIQLMQRIIELLSQGT
jgi:hypothetical protein